MKAARSTKAIVMLGVHPNSKVRGGIASVIDVYRSAGLFTHWPILYLGTYASGSSFGKIKIAIQAWSKLLLVLSRGQVALLHAHTSSRASFWRKSIFVITALAARTPVIVHLHGSEFEQFYSQECGALRKWYVRGILNRVDRVVVLSSQWKAFIERIAPSAKVVKIFNPILTSSLDASTMSASGRHSNVLLFLGRFGRRKGIFDLLQALDLIRKRFPEVRLACGGDGDVSGVTARAKEIGVDDCVDMLGWVSGADKQRVLSQSTVYVLPSYAEGLPMAILEAMAAGMPIVSTDIGGIPDAISDGENGFLIKPGDIGALAERIMQLLEDSALRVKFASAAQEKVSQVFSTDVVLSQVENLYRSLGAASHATLKYKDERETKYRGVDAAS